MNESTGGLRILTALQWRVIFSAIALVVDMGLAASQPVGAQTDPTSCGHFDRQEDAQAVLDSGLLADPSVLDPDGDGTACEFRFGEQPGEGAVYDPISCGHFETQEAAQAAFDAGQFDDPSVLDPDGDGIACEFAFGIEGESQGSGTETVVALPETGAGPMVTSGFSGSLIAVALLLGAGFLAGLHKTVRR
jgi:hypothetical protein